MKATGNLALDTNAVIAYREGIPEVCDAVDAAEGIILPVTVLGELQYGALNSTKVRTNEKFVQKFASSSFVVPIDAAVADRYARIRLELKRKGTPIPENDIWIAATCLEMEVPLLSRDEHFRLVAGLDTRSWENLDRN